MIISQIKTPIETPIKPFEIKVLLVFFQKIKYTPLPIYLIPAKGIWMVFFKHFSTLCKFVLAYTMEIWCNAKKIKDFKQWLKQFKTS